MQMKNIFLLFSLAATGAGAFAHMHSNDLQRELDSYTYPEIKTVSHPDTKPQSVTNIRTPVLGLDKKTELRIEMGNSRGLAAMFYVLGGFTFILAVANEVRSSNRERMAETEAQREQEKILQPSTTFLAASNSFLPASDTYKPGQYGDLEDNEGPHMQSSEPDVLEGKGSLINSPFYSPPRKEKAEKCNRPPDSFSLIQRRAQKFNRTHFGPLDDGPSLN